MLRIGDEVENGNTFNCIMGIDQLINLVELYLSRVDMLGRDPLNFK